MTVNSEKLVQDLMEKTRINIKQAEKFRSLSKEQLNQRMEKDSWSILECLQHLNLYGDFYIPEIKSRIEHSKTQPKKDFKSGMLGNYFANMMSPKEHLNKMKTFKDKNPIGSALDASTIQRFIAQQEQLLNLLDQSRKVDLNKTKTSISISKLIKLKLGDTFRFVIYHNDRHIAQANRILKQVNRIPA